MRPLNEVEREFLAQFKAYSDYEDCRPGARIRSSAMDKKDTSDGLSLYYYQKQAIKSWELASRVGMLSMATGTGKTITALFSIKPLIAEGRPILIIVPSRILMFQWYENIRKFYPNVPILLAGGGNNWKAEPKRRMFVSETHLPRIILSTMNTASTDDFIRFFQQAKDPVLVADEAHRLGSPVNRRISMINFKERLGLSATPERLFDPEGNKALMDLFGFDPVFELKLGGMVKLEENDDEEVPILGTFLSNYIYDFEIVHLDDEEQAQWDDLTNKIRRIFSRKHSKLERDIFEIDNEYLRYLLIRRAQILKHAKGKIECSCRIIENKYHNNKWIVYCDNESQMNQVAYALRAQNRDVPVLTYYSKMDLNDRNCVLSYLERNPCIVVSIRCLDEGVDIPSIDGALILASSNNPREYIQRRGRVLRIAEGKVNATIIDTIVLPNLSSGEDEGSIPIIRGELARAWEFAKLAKNKDVSHRLWQLCLNYGSCPCFTERF